MTSLPVCNRDPGDEHQERPNLRAVVRAITDGLARACDIALGIEQGEPQAEDIRSTARDLYGGDRGSDIEIDSDAMVSVTPDGAWVAAWVWVDGSEIA